MSGLFISYRRDDTQGYAGRLAHELSRELGPDRVFSDIEIPPGSDFGDVLYRAIAASDALLVVIGRRWAADAGEGRPPRLFDPDDWVRTEIEAALAQGKLIIPVLVGGAAMPAAATLPESIRPMTRLQAACFDDRHWEMDLATLITRLRTLLPDLGESPDRPSGGVAQAPVPNDSLAQVLREIAQRVLDESRARQAEHTQPRPAATGAGHVQGLLRALLRALSRAAKIVLMLALIYAGLRLFGDDSLLRQLDALELRLSIAWQRLLAYAGMR